MKVHRYVKRALWGAAALGVAYFAVQGGEYGTTDLVRLDSRRARLEAELDSLQRLVDSLGRYKRALQTDRELQERIAREEFGMVRGDREILYRFSEPRAGAAAAAEDGRRR